MTHPTCCYYKETVLRRIVVNDFLTLQNGVEMNCVPGVNVIIGENGTGKSTLMKLIYAVRTSFDTEVYGMEHGQLSLFVPFRDKNYDGVEHLPIRQYFDADDESTNDVWLMGGSLRRDRVMIIVAKHTLMMTRLCFILMYLVPIMTRHIVQSLSPKKTF